MIKFGVAGNSNSFYSEGYKHTYQAGIWCKERGIDIFEYSFGKGVKMTEATAKKIGDEFRKNNVELSVHAPYYINFANQDSTMIEKSINYVLESLEKLSWFNNGERIVFHPATQGKVLREDAVAETKKNLEKLAIAIVDAGYSDNKICIETMGKKAQIGTVEEVVEFCNIAPFFYPCIDFGHINARTNGTLKTAFDYEKIITYMLENLPFEKVKNMHVHFSKIMYSAMGEIKHLTFADDTFGPEFEPLSEILWKYELTPKIICESDGTQAEDAIYMKNYYFSNK